MEIVHKLSLFSIINKKEHHDFTKHLGGCKLPKQNCIQQPVLKVNISIMIGKVPDSKKFYSGISR